MRRRWVDFKVVDTPITVRGLEHPGTGFGFVNGLPVDHLAAVVLASGGSIEEIDLKHDNGHVDTYRVIAKGAGDSTTPNVIDVYSDE